MANEIPAIRGLWWASCLCNSSAIFLLINLTHTLLEAIDIVSPNPSKGTNTAEWGIVWLMVEKGWGFVVSGLSLKIVSSLRILLRETLQRFAVHYTSPLMTEDYSNWQVVEQVGRSLDNVFYDYPFYECSTRKYYGWFIMAVALWQGHDKGSNNQKTGSQSHSLSAWMMLPLKITIVFFMDDVLFYRQKEVILKALLVKLFLLS